MEAMKKFTIGDTIPLEQADRSDTFFMVVLNGEKYLVDRTGKVLLTPLQKRGEEDKKLDPVSEKQSIVTPEFAESIPKPLPPKPERMNFRFKPGSPEFSQAVREASGFINFFSGHLQKSYFQIASGIESQLEQTRTPYIRYFESDKDPLASMKAFLIHDFFCKTKLSERGLKVLEFLTIFVARDMEGNFRQDSQLSRQNQRMIVLHFIEFIKTIGAIPERERVFLKIHHEFSNELNSLSTHSEGVGYYIRVSVQRLFDQLRIAIENEGNQNFIQTAFYRSMNQPIDLYLDNILAFLKVMLIIRLNSLTCKEERGANDKEREALYYRILSFHPEWYILQ